MATNPSIILSGIQAPKPTQLEDPLSVYGKVLGIQGEQQAQAQNQQLGAQKIQSNAIELQQQQRALAYQQAFTDAVKNNTTQNPDGTFTTNYGAVRGKIVDAGFGDKAMEMDASLAASAHAALENMKLRNENETARVARVAGVARGLLNMVDPNADPATQQAQQALFVGAAPAGIAHLAQMGDLPPDQAAQLLGSIKTNGYTPQARSWLQAQADAAVPAQAALEHTDKLLTLAMDKRKADSSIAEQTANTAKANQEIADKNKSDLTAQLSNVNSPADYAAGLAKADPKIASQLPDPKDLDFSNPGSVAASQDKIRMAGMNAKEQAEYLLHKGREQSLAETRAGTLALHQDMQAFLRSQHEGQLPPAQQKEADKDNAQVSRNIQTIGALSKTAGDLATALGQPNSFVDEKGRQMTMEEHLKNQKPADSDVLAAQAQMGARLEATKAQLATITKQSHDIMDKWHGQPEQDRATALASIDGIGTDVLDSLKGKLAAQTQAAQKSGGAAKTSPPAATPPPPATPAPAATPPPAAKPPAQPQGKAALTSLPSTVSSKLTVGVPTRLNDSKGNSITVVKQADGKVYLQ